MKSTRQALFAFASLSVLAAGYGAAGLIDADRPPPSRAAPAPVRLRPDQSFTETTLEPPYIPEPEPRRRSLDATPRP